MALNTDTDSMKCFSHPNYPTLSKWNEAANRKYLRFEEQDATKVSN